MNQSYSEASQCSDQIKAVGSCITSRSQACPIMDLRQNTAQQINRKGLGSVKCVNNVNVYFIIWCQ